MTTIHRRDFLRQAAGAAVLGSRPLAAQEPDKNLEHGLTVISGTPRERGRTYGAAFKESIRAFLEREIYASFSGKPNARELMLKYAGACGKATREFSPIVHEEMEGLAEGSGLRLEEVVLLSNHEEL